MVCYQIENLSFTYPSREKKALKGIRLSVRQGEFVTLCGTSGCGKTTLLRLLKPSITPHGKQEGTIWFNGVPTDALGTKEAASKIGFVLQDPEHQIVTDKVWHELAFGLESLGYSTAEIRTRVSEMASFFGIQNWFHESVASLSGGQKQLLNLASVMVMQPSVLILDEPTAQLDPIAAQEFLKTLERVNRELGTTVILSEHRLEDAFALSDRVWVLDEGKLIADGTPQEVGQQLCTANHELFCALPTPMRVYGAVENGMLWPLTVREGRQWLDEYANNHTLHETCISNKPALLSEETAITVKDLWFRYGKDLPDVVKGLNLQIQKGELFALVGGNGTGKSTTLSLIAQLLKPYRGTVQTSGTVALLPQHPQCLFLKQTVYEDLRELSDDEEQLRRVAALCRIGRLFDAHPYDLSGGEQQRVALAKVLLLAPDILLLDEPTKGMDAAFKGVFADILSDLKEHGVTVVMVSHDIAFCAEYADRCAMFFDGAVTSVDEPRTFFAGKSFYTTSANRMARAHLPDAVLAEDIIVACGKTPPKRTCTGQEQPPFPTEKQEKSPATSKKRKFWGWTFVIAFLLIQAIASFFSLSDTSFLKFALVLLMVGGAVCLFPSKAPIVVGQPRKLQKRTVAVILVIFVAVLLTLYVGTTFFGGRKYYGISLLILAETLVPFFLLFEQRKPKARELVLIGVLCALGVSGRAAFFMLSQFKPVAAIVILVGVCFGAESGFLVGSLTAFVSNFFFGQGPWTPWQMAAFGLIGLAAGLLFRKRQVGRGRLCFFGAAATLLIYGGIMNPASVLLSQTHPTGEMFAAAYLAGLPLDLVHAASTAFFLCFLAVPMAEKLERIKTKYGMELQ